MELVIETMLEDVLNAAIPIISAVISLIGFYASKYIRAKIKNEKEAHNLSLLGTIADVVVKSLMQTEVNDLKSLNGGGLKGEEAAVIKGHAIEHIKAGLPNGMAKSFAKSGVNIDFLIHNLIESRVHEAKK